MNDSPLLLQLLELLGAIVLVVPIVQRVGLGSVPGYLLAGVLVGPSALGLLSQDEVTGRVAELGVVFLMFAIGIELSPRRLWLMRRLVFGLGNAQLLGSALALGLLALTLDTAPVSALVIGFGLALSSTALVLQLVGERRELATAQGRAALSVLLMQDVAVAPLISLVYLLGEGSAAGGDGMMPGALRSVAALVAFLLVGRWVLHRALPLVASSRNPDLLVAAALLLVLGAAWLMESAGFTLALGAFLAGVLLADSPFRHQVVADVHPFRGILLGLFFLTVGMSLDLRAAAQQLPLLLGLTTGFMLVKAVVMTAVARLFGLATDASIRLGLQLAQGGEFALVLFTLAAGQALVAPALQELLVQALVLSLLLAPLAFTLGDRLAARFAPGGPLLEPVALAAELAGHVVICGYGRVGSQIANLFEAAGQRWVAADQDPETVQLARLAGLPVCYGDAARPAILRALRIEHAALAVVTLDDADAAERCVHAIRLQAPRCRVVARSADLAHAHGLREHGVARAVPETAEYSLQLGMAGLVELGVDAERVLALEDRFRRDDYARLLANRTGMPMRR